MEKCFSCGGDLRIVKDKPYHYDECGLNVVLYGITQYSCKSCGESYGSIPNMQKLHRIIGAHICTHQKAILQPEEVKFLRKDLQLQAKNLAKALGVTPETVSRWENGKKIMSETHDRLLRSLYMMYASEQAHHMIIDGVLQLFQNLPLNRKSIEQPSEITLNPQEWLTQVGECCSG